VAGRLGEELRPVVDGTAFWIGRTVNQPRDPRMGDGAGAHGARLQCGIEPQIGQSIIANSPAGRAQSLDFGMRARIVKADRRILSYGDDGFT